MYMKKILRGKYKGRTPADVVAEDADYADWVIKNTSGELSRQLAIAKRRADARRANKALRDAEKHDERGDIETMVKTKTKTKTKATTTLGKGSYYTEITDGGCTVIHPGADAERQRLEFSMKHRLMPLSEYQERLAALPPSIEERGANNLSEPEIIAELRRTVHYLTATKYRGHRAHGNTQLKNRFGARETLTVDQLRDEIKFLLKGKAK